jgi:hypothetical protein
MRAGTGIIETGITETGITGIGTAETETAATGVMVIVAADGVTTMAMAGAVTK